MQANKSKSCGDVHGSDVAEAQCVCQGTHIPQHEGSAGLMVGLMMVGLRAVLGSAGRSLVGPNHIWLVPPAGGGGAVLVEEGVVSCQRPRSGL